MRRTGFDSAFMFAYSDRERTYAARHLQVPGRLGGADGAEIHLPRLRWWSSVGLWG